MNTLVLGASPNPDRYSYKAVRLLKSNNHLVYPIGIKKGEIDGLEISPSKESIPNIHTVTLYLNPGNQKQWYDYILSLKPSRIIFNPGTENPELQKLAKENGIFTEEACTLVLLHTNQYTEYA